jgi:F-type H+-transporting ATPase subunit epsilon
MRFSLISVAKKVFETDTAKSVTVSTKTGTITILENHEPLVSALMPGVLSVVSAEGEKRFAVGGGVLETDGKTVAVLADMAEDGGIDPAEARARKEEAARLLKEAREAGTADMAAIIALEEEYMKEEARVKLSEGTL